MILHETFEAYVVKQVLSGGSALPVKKQKEQRGRREVT